MHRFGQGIFRNVTEEDVARAENQKLKLCYIMKILSECTSKGDGITMTELIDRLAECGVSAERKSIYSDIRAINEFGEAIRVESYRKDNETRYYADGRLLTLAEIKLLADVIAASKFVTEKKSRELIGKLEHMVSAKERRELNRTVYIRRHATDTDDGGYSNVDPIQKAIRENRQIEFEYLQWNSGMQLVSRDGKPRSGISPWWLVYNHENYYLGAYDGIRGGMRTFRVDKMRNIHILEKPREGSEAAEQSSPDLYAQARFEMFDGTPERVRVSCPTDMLGMFVDKIGQEISVLTKENGVELSFRIVPNRFFLAWLMALGSRVKLLSPQHCVDEMETMCMQMITDHERREIKNVIFDLGCVLVRLRPEEYMEELGFSAEIREFFRERVLFREEWQLMDEGALSQEDAIARWSSMKPAYSDAIVRFFKGIERLAEPYPDTEPIILSLKERGYRVYALTNYPREMFALHEEKSLPFLSLLDGYVVSGCERRFKPNEDFYELLLSRYQLKASESVFIDDREDNIRTAKALGIHSIPARDRDSAMRELEAFLAAHAMGRE